MTDEEIRTSYRDAKYKKMQIRILSELTLKPREEICRIVGAEQARPKRTKAPRERWTKEEYEFVLSSIAEGKGYAWISEQLGRSYESVAGKHYYMTRYGRS